MLKRERWTERRKTRKREVKEVREIETERKKGNKGKCSADGAGVILAGLHFPLQQQDHHRFSQVAGGSFLPQWRSVIEHLHLLL